MTFPYRAHMITEFGGTFYSKARTLDEAIAKALAHKNPTAKIKIVRRWVTDTKGVEFWAQT